MPAPPRVAVAASGGLDSTALLHCVARVACAIGVRTVALHVNHRLQPGADRWQAQVRRQALRWGAGFVATQLGGSPPPGDSIEAWARCERYRALAAMAHAERCDLVLLAQHRRDQAETFLLQALRGGGAAGLAAMPRQAWRDGMTFVRPWLDCPRAAIEAYVRRHRLTYVDDPSNADPRFARSRLRLQVWPALRQAFPDAEQVLAQAASRAADDAAVVAAQAEGDLRGLTEDGAFRVAEWLELPPARRAPALRTWLGSCSPLPVPETLVRRLIEELPTALTGRWPLGEGELRAYRGRLRWHAGRTEAARVAVGVAEQPIGLHAHLPNRCPGWPGRFALEPARERGVSPGSLNGLVARARLGGERFSLAPGAAVRSLKKQYQAAGVPPWDRVGPLLYNSNGELLFAPGLGIDARRWAPEGARQWQIRWVPDAPA